MSKLIPCFLLAAGLAAAPASATDGDAVDERRALRPDARVSVSNTAGTIDVVAWDRNELHLTGTLDDKVEKLEITGGERELRIEVVVPGNTRHVGDSDLQLRVPAGVSLRLQAVSADISVKGIRGELEASSVSGDVTLEVGSERVQARSVSGDVEIKAPARDTRAETVSGDLTLRGLRGEVRGETVSGDISIEGGEFSELELETVSGDVGITGSLEKDVRLSVRTLSGTVTCTAPELPGGTVRMQTFSGSLTNEWHRDVGNAKNYEQSTSGKARIDLHSFSGDIELRKR